MKNRLYVHALIDASTSMLPVKGPTLTAYNQYVESLDNDAVVSLSTFSSRGGIKRIHTNVDPGRAKLLADDYECRGDTPLYDAIGETIQEIDTAAKEFDRIVIVIQTDGADNTSREFNREKVRQMLTDKQEGEGWLVVFLGANLQAAEQAAYLGIAAANAMQYEGTNSEMAFASVGRATRSYNNTFGSAVGARGAAAFTDDERKRSR